MWVQSGPWVDGAASIALFSSLVLGQISTSGSTAESSDRKPIPRCTDGCDFQQVPMVAAAWSLDVSLSGQDYP